MRRFPFALRIDSDNYSEFFAHLENSWPTLSSFLKENQIRNFSLWEADGTVFGYAEGDSDLCLSPDQKKLLSSISESFTPFINWLSLPGESMRLMYEFPGQISEDKSLIRHRVFMTRLKEGAEEEYKHRHDVLAQNQSKQPDAGPDSNFTIWYAGGLIFGYDEIHTTQETPISPLGRSAQREWESKMLEIMTWVTDDVDWLTGEHHPHIRKIAHYN